jgi:hypothetical protein
VLISTFDDAWKQEWLGKDYADPNLVRANDVDKSNVSDVRVMFRFTNLMRELHYLALTAKMQGDALGNVKLANLSIPLQGALSPAPPLTPFVREGGASACLSGVTALTFVTIHSITTL